MKKYLLVVLLVCFSVFSYAQETENPLGPDPQISGPELEEAPSSESILSPVFGLLSDFYAYVVPSHSGVCPVGNISIFGNYITFDYHCQLLNPIYSDMAGLMLSVWLLSAVFIILSA